MHQSVCVFYWIVDHQHEYQLLNFEHVIAIAFAITLFLWIFFWSHHHQWTESDFCRIIFRFHFYLHNIHWEIWKAKDEWCDFLKIWCIPNSFKQNPRLRCKTNYVSFCFLFLFSTAWESWTNAKILSDKPNSWLIRTLCLLIPLLFSARDTYLYVIKLK